MIDFSNDIHKCVETLQNGGLILYPTDTIWGIGCDATNEAAVRKIYALKKRSDEKAMIVLVAAEKDIRTHVANAPINVFEYLKKATRPTTVIYDGAIGLAENLIGKDGTVAMRLTSDPFCKQLIKSFKKPVVSTSANISGDDSPQIFNDIIAEIKNGVDYIVQHRQHDLTKAMPSAIIKWLPDGSHLVIRS
jgi:L-threonylcarbamoyladenylate synthase